MTDVISHFYSVQDESRKRGEHRDCAVRAVAVATDYDYDDVHWLYGIKGRKPKRGTPWEITQKVVKALNFRMVDVTDHLQSKTIRTLEREMAGIKGRFLILVRRHLLPMVDGKVYDWSAGRCHRIIRVYKMVEEENRGN